ncbi:12872_t:CDS:2, partial [Acaulospora colombiana]
DENSNPSSSVESLTLDSPFFQTENSKLEIEEPDVGISVESESLVREEPSNNEYSMDPKTIEESPSSKELSFPVDVEDDSSSNKFSNIEKDSMHQEDILNEDDIYEVADSSDGEIDRQMEEENSEFARFLSELQQKDINSIQKELNEEIDQLNEQQRKEKRDADGITQLMVNDCQKLLELFGIPFVNAPMEAEAQCAELLRQGLVDGIITDDKDFECELKLDREKLIRLAILLGSDYSEGLPGVGVVNAMEIFNEFPDEDGLEKFRDWWFDVQSGTHTTDDAEKESENPISASLNLKRKIDASNSYKNDDNSSESLSGEEGDQSLNASDALGSASEVEKIGKTKRMTYSGSRNIGNKNKRKK